MKPHTSKVGSFRDIGFFCLNILKYINMPVKNNSSMEVLDKKGEYLFTISFNEITGNISLYEEKGDIDDAIGFYAEIQKDDWASIKYFIDTQLTFDSQFLIQESND